MHNDHNFLFNEPNENTDIVASNHIKSVTSIPINYVGNKKRLLIHIHNLLKEKNIIFDRIIDPFTGSGVVSAFFGLLGYKVVANDILTSSSLALLSIMKGRDIGLQPTELDYILYNQGDLLTSFADNYRGMFFNEEETTFLNMCKSNIVRLCGNSFLAADDKSIQIIPNVNETVKDQHNQLKATLCLFLLEKAITDICFVGGRYYNGQIIAKLEHRISHNKSKQSNLVSMLRKKNKWMLKVYDRLLSVPSSFIFNDDARIILEKYVDSNDMVYLDPPYGGNSSDYSYLYKFLEEFLYERPINELDHVVNCGKKFNNKKKYDFYFNDILDKCSKSKYLLISFNGSSFNTIENICDSIKKFKSNIFVKSIPIAYNYRKDRSNFQYTEGIQDNTDINESEREFLILAQ